MTEPASDASFCSQCGQRFAAATDRFCARCGRPRTGSQVTLSASAEPLPEQTGPKKSAMAFVVIVSIALAVVPIFFCFGGLGGGTATGTLKARGPRGDFTFVPDGCQSLQHFGRAGANVHGKTPNDGGVYVSVDPVSGTRVDVEIPGSCKNADGTDCTVFEVPRDRCKVWQVGAEFTGTVVNDIRQYKGKAQLDCTLDDGTSITADLVFDDC